MMTLTKFQMGLWALTQVDMQEMVDAGAIADRDYAAWDAFNADRVGWLLAHASNAEGVWRAMWKSMRRDTDPTSPDNVVELRPKQGRHG